MKIIIDNKCKLQPELKYILSVVLDDFLGLEYEVSYASNCNGIYIEHDENRLIIDDSFFRVPKDLYLTRESLPKQPLNVWSVLDTEWSNLFVEPRIPIIYGNSLANGEYLFIDTNEIRIGIDILGSSFFMLTRYEEYVKKERDNLARFSAKDSLAYQEGFLERPIINEYIELLWWCINKLWPELKRKKREYKFIPTHDVDRPSALLGFGYRPQLQRFAGDILYRKDWSAFFKRGQICMELLKHGFKGEWKYTFDHIMDISELYNVKSTFFFMTPTGLPEYDGLYHIDHPDIVNLIKHIIARGHNIGVHPSYASYNNPEIIKDNVNRLREVINQSGIKCRIGGRQHYLRWEAATTWQAYEDAGLVYDTTLSFADHIGFRCGICYDYKCFNLKTRKKMLLREFPLIIMEGTAFDYMGLSEEQVIERSLNLKKLCKKYNGNFIILWHNDKFIEDKMVRAYGEILQK